jgi:hypothetical protein
MERILASGTRLSLNGRKTPEKINSKKRLHLIALISIVSVAMAVAIAKQTKKTKKRK